MIPLPDKTSRERILSGFALCLLKKRVRVLQERTAFASVERTHQESGKIVRVAGTSCRVVSFPAFEAELAANGLAALQKGLTESLPDFSRMMYAVVGRG